MLYAIKYKEVIKLRIPGKFSDILNLIFSFIGVFFLIMYPGSCIDAAKDGLTTALYIALPSLFPFMVLSKFIIAGNFHYLISKIIGKPFEYLFGINKKYSVLFILGCIGGYPIGAIAINDMLCKDEISVKDAEHLLGFCNNSGPMFIIGTVGTLLLNDTKFGYVLYTIHILCTIMCGIIMRVIFKPEKSTLSSCIKNHKSNSPLSTSITDAGISMINIASYIVVFSVISSFIIKVFATSGETILSSTLCFLEITTGIKHAAASNLPEVLKISLISGALGFSGLCVFSQSRAVFENNNISFSKYFFAKLITALLSFIMTYITFTIIFSN